MGKWIEWATAAPNEIDQDYSAFEGVRIFVQLSNLGDQKYVQSLAEQCSWYRSKNLKIMLCIDYHVQYPIFHAPPPKWPSPDDSQLGYAPFGWKRGWICIKVMMTCARRGKRNIPTESICFSMHTPTSF